MIVRDHYRLSHPDAPMAASYGTKAMCVNWRDRLPPHGPNGQVDREGCQIEPVPYCACCGRSTLRPGDTSDCITTWRGSVTRCSDHHDRNPCAIEGCRRTTSADGRVADDQWLCPIHWRAFVPPRSALRRTYHRFFRLAKRQGWDKPLRLRFWRFWVALIARARRQAGEGHIDPAAIAALFGWDGA